MLPGCPESLNAVGGSANAGVTKTSVGINSSTHLVMSFMAPSVLLACASRALCRRAQPPKIYPLL